MCGIFGICYTRESREREDWTTTEIAQLLFPAIRHRGPHAFGWMTWNGTDGIQVEKHPGDVSEIRNLKLVEPDDGAQWMVGHVRYATHGDPEDVANDHPIPHGDIVGVHNGVLRNHVEILKETGRQDEDTEVDSEAIFAAVNKWGHAPGLRRIAGDMIAVYSRFSKPGNVWFAKSTGRPLIFARTRAGSLVFASELGVLRSVWGDELTDVREIKARQLVRVFGGRVKEVRQFAQAPVPVRQVAPRAPRVQRSERRGVSDDVFERLRDQVRGERPKPDGGMSKKQRRRAKRAARIRAEEAARDVEGFYWYQGMAVTPEEWRMLQEADASEGNE